MQSCNMLEGLFVMLLNRCLCYSSTFGNLTRISIHETLISPLSIKRALMHFN